MASFKNHQQNGHSPEALLQCQEQDLVSKNKNQKGFKLMPRKKSFHVSLLQFGKTHYREKCEIHETLGAASCKRFGWVTGECLSLSVSLLSLKVRAGQARSGETLMLTPGRSPPPHSWFLTSWRLCVYLLRLQNWLNLLNDEPWNQIGKSVGGLKLVWHLVWKL